jgi:adenylate cyclase
MSEIFISYARSTEAQAEKIADALRALGYGVWRDDELPAHRAYSEVIEERLKAAKAVVVMWSAEAVKSHWVRAEADAAREAGTLVQVKLDDTHPPMPFNQIQCANLAGWDGDTGAPGWRKIAESVAELVGATSMAAGFPLPEPSAAAPLPPKPSIAVMPFANLSGDAEQEYFADGMVEEIAAALSRARSLFVLGPSSSLSLKGKRISPADAGRVLGVRYLLEGSVRKAGGRVRITVKLIEAAAGDQVWADRFEGPDKDIFELQDRVAASVAGFIEPNLMMAEIARVGRRPTDNPTAYDLYLRAISLAISFEPADMLKARDYLDAAIELDPNYGNALGMAAMIYPQTIGGLTPPEERRRLAEQSLGFGRRALEAAPNDAYVLACVADGLTVLEGDQAVIRGLIDRALVLNPSSWLAWLKSGGYYVAAGEIELGIEHLETSVRLDPLSPFHPRTMTLIAAGRFGQGRIAEAAAILAEAEHMLPNFTLTRALLAACHGHLGNARAAERELAALDKVGADVLAVGRWAFSRPGEPRRLFEEGVALARDLAST